MVKTINPLQELEIAQKAVPMMHALLARVPGIRIETNAEAVLGALAAPMRPDLKISAHLPSGETWTLVCEIKRQAEPRQMRLAAYEMRDRIQGKPAGRDYAVLLAPFVSEASAKICQEAEIGYADLAGNARLAFGNTFIFIHGYANPFRVKREKNLYASRSGRVLQILFQNPQRLWKVTDLAEQAGVSLGQVSNVRRALLDREWAGLREGRLYLKQPEALLRDWRANYKPVAVAIRRAYSLMHGEVLNEALRAAFAKAGREHLLLASHSAAKWLAPFARVPTQYLYADPIGERALDECLGLQPAAMGDNIVIMRPKDDGAFLNPAEAGAGLWCTSPVQTFLDLSVAGERGEEAADFLLTDYIRKQWADQK